MVVDCPRIPQCAPYHAAQSHTPSMGYLPASTSSARALTTVAPVPSNFPLALPAAVAFVAALPCDVLASRNASKDRKRFHPHSPDGAGEDRKRPCGRKLTTGRAFRTPRSRPPQRIIVSRCYGRVLCVHGVRGLPRRSLRGKRHFPVLSAVDNVSLTLLALCGLASHRCGGTTDADSVAG